MPHKLKFLAHICNIELEHIYLFFYWAKVKPVYSVATVHFDLHLKEVGGALRNVLYTLDARHRPYHVGISEKRPISIDYIEAESSTWLSQKLGEDFFGSFIAFCADGTYPHSRKFGGHFGRQELRSYKKVDICKLMLTCTPRSEIIEAHGGFGGGHRSSDAHMWFHLRDEDNDELKSNSDAMNLVSMCRQREDVAGIVDAGFKNSDSKNKLHPAIDLFQPRTRGNFTQSPK
jgi:hypothetical protein